MSRLKKLTPLKVATAVAAVVVVAFGATALASIPSGNGTIYGCYAKSNGATRIIDPGKSKCGTSEKPISWSEQGPRGATGKAGVDGADGVSGYEQVDTVVATDRTLPIDEGFSADCPTGKSVFGGGAVIQLYNDNGFVDLGSPAMYSVPNGASQWAVWVIQAAVGGATKATITMHLVCAIASP